MIIKERRRRKIEYWDYGTSMEPYLLPEGWVWVIYDDNSGILVSPEKQLYMEFDFDTCEYAKYQGDRFHFMANYPMEYVDSDEFFFFAERYIVLSCLGQNKFGNVSDYEVERICNKFKGIDLGEIETFQDWLLLETADAEKEECQKTIVNYDIEPKI